MTKLIYCTVNTELYDNCSNANFLLTLTKIIIKNVKIHYFSNVLAFVALSKFHKY